MPIVAKLDEYGRGAWIAFAVLGFILWWPLGLATLAFTFWSGRMGCGFSGDRYEHRMSRLQAKMDRMRERIPLGTARLPSSETQADAGRLANALRLMAIEARRNIVEEGTFRNPQSVQRFVDRLQEQGYKVEMVVVATSREESLLGIYQRHERQHQVGNPNPRFVTEDYHDAAMQGFSATVSQLAHQLDRLRIINRGGQLLYDSQRQPRDDATMALQAAREIPAERRTMLADGWAAVAAAARERGANPQYLDAIGGHARRVAASAQLQGDRGARITPYTRGKEQALSRGASPAGPFTSLAATPQASKPPARSR